MPIEGWFLPKNNLRVSSSMLTFSTWSKSLYLSKENYANQEWKINIRMIIIFARPKRLKFQFACRGKMLLINNRRNKKPLCQLWPYLNIFYSKMNPFAILWFSSQFSTRFELNAENSVFVFVFWFSVFLFLFLFDAVKIHTEHLIKLFCAHNFSSMRCIQIDILFRIEYSPSVLCAECETCW